MSVATEHITEAARAARVAEHSPEARAKQSDTQRRHRKAAAAWSPSSQPDWLTEKFYLEKIQSALASVSNSAIASRLGVSRCCASRIRSGKGRPHPRHWQALAELVGVSADFLKDGLAGHSPVSTNGAQKNGLS